MFQYKQLEDKNWLNQKYAIEKTNQDEIANIIGCTSWSINNALKKHGIPIRSRSEALKLRYERKPHLSKYPLLENKDWLYQMAIVERKTYREIKELAGAKEEQHIIQMLKKHGLYEKRRLLPRVIGKSSYEILNDIKWLYDKYINEKKSTVDIAKIAGCDAGSVWKSLRRWGIKARTRIEGKEASRDRDNKGDGFELTKDVLCILNGGMLGDAGMSLSKSNTSSVVYRKTSIHKDYLEYECERILNNTNYDKYIRVRNEEGRICFDKYVAKKSFCFSTLAHKELNPIFFKWYNQIEGRNIKVIPLDIELNNDSILHWFMDDGYSYVVCKKYQTLKGEKTIKQIRVYMCTQSFQKEELDALCLKLYKI